VKPITIVAIDATFHQDDNDSGIGADVAMSLPPLDGRARDLIE
jgi:hypothetical protein